VPRAPRLFLLLILAGLVPFGFAGLIVALGPAWIEGLGAQAMLGLVAILTLIWAGALTLVAERAALRDLHGLVDVAEHQPRPDTAGRASEATGGDAAARLAASLDERNRQLAELAARTRATPISTDATTTAEQVIAAVNAVTGDATWRLAILGSSGDRLAPGVYGPGGEREPLRDVHQWAAVSEPRSPQHVRHVNGPWGAFVVVNLAADDELRAVLVAPWEGRGNPSDADLALFSLLGQYGATAIEHALLYARVREQADELHRLAQVQSDFLRGVTHDLQTPLTSIRALAAELRAAGDLGSRAVDDLETIERQADRLRRMVAQLLAVSRLDAGALEPRQELLRPAPLVQRVWDALRPERPFSVEIAGDQHLVVADPDRMEQVLWAVLDNAVKYSPTGSPIAVRIETQTGTADGLVSAIAVTDQGVGMSSSTRQRAFDQFYRAEEARALVPDGSGIGLYAARGLLEAMGGTIDIRSSPGAGSTVTIRLPAESSAER
jgi:signal transduction histidine kinase